MVSTENNLKGIYNELEIQDDFTADDHPLHRKMTRFTVRDGLNSRPYRLAAIVLGVLSAVLLFILIGLSVHINRVSDKHDLLFVNSSRNSAELTQLQTEHKSLIQSKNTLQKKHDEDTEQIKSLRSELIRNTRQNGDLQLQIRDLQEQNRKLMSQLTNLEDNCGKCLPNWVLMNTTCYYFAVADTTPRRGWDASRDDCKKRGADLVTIDKREKQLFIVETLKALRYNLPFSYRNGFWIGLKDDHTEGIWKWLNGSTLSEGFWMDGEPNDDSFKEDCAAVYPFSDPIKAWNDAPCSYPLKWICEKEMETTPNTPQ